MKGEKMLDRSVSEQALIDKYQSKLEEAIENNASEAEIAKIMGNIAFFKSKESQRKLGLKNVQAGSEDKGELAKLGDMLASHIHIAENGGLRGVKNSRLNLDNVRKVQETGITSYVGLYDDVSHEELEIELNDASDLGNISQRSKSDLIGEYKENEAKRKALLDNEEEE